MKPLWLPGPPADAGPRYLAIVAALEGDIAQGRVRPGARLPTQRDMAAQLGLSVGTIARAYVEAERRGLISGEVGRGTFVLGPPSVPANAAPVNLTLNAPPITDEAPRVAEALAQLAGAGIETLLGYLPHGGLPAHRATVAGWLRAQGMQANADTLVLCNGAQHALSVALAVAARPGDVVLTEALTYPGMAALAEIGGYRLRGVAMDGEGLRPDALDAAFARSGARVLYCMPTQQTPTGATMSPARRADILAVLRQHGAALIEDDVYAFLVPGLRPISQDMPENSYHISSFAKCAAPGLRIGALVLPAAARDRALLALRATGWMASPLAAALVVQMIETGSMAALMDGKRRAAAERWQVARPFFGAQMPPDAAPAFHLWLTPLAPLSHVITAAAMRGVVLAPPCVVAGDAPPEGLRLCLGAPETPAELARALAGVAAALAEGGAHSLV